MFYLLTAYFREDFFYDPLFPNLVLWDFRFEITIYVRNIWIISGKSNCINKAVFSICANMYIDFNYPENGRQQLCILLRAGGTVIGGGGHWASSLCPPFAFPFLTWLNQNHILKWPSITICPTTLLDLPPALTSMSLFVPLSESIFDPESKIEITKYRLYRGRVWMNARLVKYLASAGGLHIFFQMHMQFWGNK